MDIRVRDSSPSAEKLMCTVLREGRDLRPEYPLVFEDGFDGKVISAEDASGKVRSTCALLAREVVTPAASFRVGLIGSVATESEFRGRGLASRVLAAAETHAADAECVFTILWADDPAFYVRRGYMHVGYEKNYLIDNRFQLETSARGVVRELRPADVGVVHALYSEHATRVSRTESETRALISAPGVRTLVWESDGLIVAYTCMGRGEDLKGVVHEWGGPAPDVATLLTRHRDENGSVIVMLPGAETSLDCLLTSQRIPVAEGVLGMAKVVNPPRARDVFDTVLGANSSVEPGEGRSIARISGPRGVARLTREEVLMAICAPRGDRCVAESIEDSTGLSLRGLPLDPFLWGLDSI